MKFLSDLLVQGDGNEIFLKSADHNISRIIPRGTGANLDKGLFSLYDTGTEDVRIDTAGNSWFNGGNVGIGTASPSQKLHVVGDVKFDGSRDIDFNTTNGDIKITPNSGGWATGYFFNGSAGTYRGGFGSLGSSDALTYYWIGDAYNDATMVIQPNAGNVGIGTTSPDTLLHIESTISTSSPIFTIQNDNDIKLKLGAVRSGAGTAPDSTFIAYDGDLRFIADADSTTEVVRIDSSGNVGIGTTSPSKKLHVNGSYKLGTNAYIQYDAAYPYTINIQNTASAGDIKLQSANGENKILLQPSTGGIDFYTNSSEIMRITDGGNVGIGTTSPSEKLQVNGTAGFGSNMNNNAVKISVNQASTFPGSNTSNSRFIDFLGGNIGANTEIGGIRWLNTDSDNGNYQYHAAGITSHNGGSSNDGDLRFFVSSNASADSSTGVIEAVRVDINGNVGIGTTSPSTKLHVEGDGSIIRLQNNNSDTNGTFIDFRDSGGARTGYVGTTGASDDMFLFTQGSKPIRFYTYGTERMRITSGGNVGIGTTSPGSLLEVHKDSASGQFATYRNNTGFFLHRTYADYNNDGAIVEFQQRIGVDGNYSRIGNYSNHPLYLMTNNSTNMTLLTDGNVGIGTTSPSTKLDVVGNTRLGSGTLHVSTDQTFGTGFTYSFRDAVGILNPNGTSAASATAVMSIGGMSNGYSLVTTGNVGIGTAAPSQKLHVAGKGLFTDFVRFNGVTAPDFPVDIDAVDGGKSLRSTRGTSVFRIDQGNDGPGYIGMQSADDFSIQTNNTSKIYITSAGNVGIGTTSPARKLHVSEAGNGNIALFTNTTDADLNINLTSGVTMLTPSTALLAFGTSSSERMRIDGSGNVGIGTTAPGAKLHVDSSTAFSLTAATGDTLFLSDDTSTSELNGVGASIGFSGPQAVQRQAAIAALRTGDDHDKIGLAFYTHPGSGNDETIVEKLRIDHDGNVGIGTASPGEKLEVAGNIKIGDSNVMYLGAGNDLQIYHDGSNSYITDTGTGNLLITSNGASVQINKGLTENMAEFIVDGAVNLYYDSAKKFETTSTGATVSGALAVSGKITNLTAGTGNLDAVNVQQLNNATTGTLIYKGTWSAAPTTTSVLDGAVSSAGTIVIDAVNPGISVGATITGTGISGTVTVSNIAADGITIAISSAQTIADGVTLTFTTVGGTPDLSQASRKVTGHYYICETAGAVTPNGAGTTPNEWAVGDWATFSDLTTDAWQKIDNSSVLSGAGTGGKVPVWSGTGTSVTLADAPITVSGNNATFAGNVAMVTGNSTGKFAVKSAGVHASYDFYNNGTSYFNGGVVVDAGFSQTGGADVTFTGDVAISSTMPKLTFTDLQQDDWRIMNDNGDFRFTNIDGSGHALILATNNNATFAGDVTVGGKTYPKISLTDNQGVARTFSVGTNNETFTVRNETASSDAFTISNANNATFAGDVTVNGSHLTLANGTTSAAATDYLYIGGDGLASADAAIYIGNGGGNTVDGYGYRIYYSGAGAGNNNKLIFKSENYQSAEIDMLTFTADGKSTFSQDATFAGEATFNGSDGHINLDGNNAVIFDNSNNNNAWYIRNGGSNAATLQMGTGSSPGSNIKLTINSSGDATFAGNITFGDSHTIGDDSDDNLVIASSASENIIIDSADDIILDAAGNDVLFKDAGTHIGTINMSSSNLTIESSVSDKDIIFKGKDGASAITALTLDMSNGGSATFVDDIDLGGKITQTGTGNNTFAGQLTVGSSGTGRDVTFHGNLAGEYFQWDENVSTVNIYHRDELPGLEVYVNGAEQTTQPQIKVGRSSTQYWGAYVDDRNAHLVHRQDETSGTMTTRFDQWDSNTSDLNGEWLWRYGNGTGGSMTNALTLTQAGNATFAGTINSGTITSTGIVKAATTFQATGGDMTFYVNNFGEAMRVQQNTGEVGIGTTDPKSKLHVNGGIQMAGDTAAASADKVGTMRYRTGTEYVEVDGTELVTNGDFAADSNWTKETGWTIASGVASYNGTSANNAIYQSPGITTGSIYRLSFSVVNYVSGTLIANLSSGQTSGGTGNITANGDYSFNITASGSLCIFRSTASFSGSIDNVSVIEVTAEDASYADMCMQTGSSTYEWVNIVRNTY